MKIKLRAWREDDAARLYDIYRATPDLVHQMPALGSVEDARTLICEELLPSSEHIAWCLEADNQAAGCVGFRCMGASLLEPGIELGFTIGSRQKPEGSV